MGCLVQDLTFILKAIGISISSTFTELGAVLPEGTPFSRVLEVSWFCLGVVSDSIPFLLFLEYTFTLFPGAVSVVGAAVSTAISSTFSDVVSCGSHVGSAVS